MGSELETLEARARELAEVAAGLAEAEFLAAGRFLVSVVGEFQRGKSTLIKALLGAEVLPAGVLPLTAVATEGAFGDPGAFRAGTQQRVDAVRQVAADLFATPLPRTTVPAVAEERERFFYFFLHVGSFNEPFGRLVGRLVPTGTARRRALLWARAELVREFDKHAGQARWDLTQRLDAVRRRFERALRHELDETIDAILAAARAEELRRAAAAAQRATRAAQAQRQPAVGAAFAELVEPNP